MDQTPATSPQDTTIAAEGIPAPTLPRLFNDEHFERRNTPATPRDITWAPFGRLPAELRLQVWLTCLQQRRMLELDICPTTDEEPTAYPGDGSQYYTKRNALGNVISGRRYVLSWKGRLQSHVGSYSLLLCVNHEARQITLGFYRVHLPCFGLQRDQVLYLNPEDDVVSIQPRRDEHGTIPFRSLPLLADFLHDVKAYDPKGQGIAHLALSGGFLSCYSTEPDWQPLCLRLTPEALHPTAAASFTDILKRRLRSVLLLIRFRSCYRGMAEVPPYRGYKYHFAQNFPLARRNHPIGTFHWLETDPRPGVEVDIRQMPLGEDPRALTTGWRQMEQAFGITRPTEDQNSRQHEHGQQHRADGGLRLYICPRLKWPQKEREEMRWLTRRMDSQPLAEDEDEKKEEEEEAKKGPRAELTRHLREEADDWDYHRTWLHKVFGSSPNSRIMPKQGYVLDAETFERMERLPCTAVGMWLFPAEAFMQPFVPRRLCFDMSAV